MKMKMKKMRANELKEATSNTMLTLGNLKKLPELTENDRILVHTAEGIIKEISYNELERYVNKTPDSDLNLLIQLENNKVFVIQQESGKINLSLQIPNVENGVVIRSRIFVLSPDISITWGGNVIGTDSSKAVSELGNTEFLLTHYKGLNDSIYLTRL